uniref:Ermin n=1 Tax=Esox lucius TaxID=8010 RepID=A0A6Q2XTU8_ESOLU
MEFWWNTADFLEGMGLEVEESSIFSHVMQTIDRIANVLSTEPTVDPELQENDSDDNEDDDEDAGSKSDDSEEDKNPSNAVECAAKVIIKKPSSSPIPSSCPKRALVEAATEMIGDVPSLGSGASDSVVHGRTAATAAKKHMRDQWTLMTRERAGCFPEGARERPEEPQTQPPMLALRTRTGLPSRSLAKARAIPLKRDPLARAPETGGSTGQWPGKGARSNTFTEPRENSGEPEEEECEEEEEQGVNVDGRQCSGEKHGTKPVSKYHTVSYRKIRKGNTKQRIDEFESMVNT